MDLSPEDQLRLNVLLAHDLEAVRIDEQGLAVYALAGGSEARVPLNPTCRPEKYLKRVRELLSIHALGSPSGYPVFLQRWTRMGQARDAQLGKLLLLGEPEAVVAVAGAPGLTGELARRVWWTMPTPDIARRMLEREAVAQSEMGKVLTDFLIEHLPFETDPATVIHTVRLVLKTGLPDEETRRRIWSRGTHRNAYHLGFLAACPHDLPERHPARSDLAACDQVLAPLTARGNRLAALLRRLLDGPGQTFLAVSEELLRHPLDKETVAMLLDVIGAYFAPARLEGESASDVVQAVGRAEAAVAAPPAGSELAALLAALPSHRSEIAAMLALAHCGEPLVTPILARTSASGTVLRRRLEPAFAPLLRCYATLRAERVKDEV